MKYFKTPSGEVHCVLEGDPVNLPNGVVEISEAEAYTLIAPTDEDMSAAARNERDDRLSACDWVVIRAHEMGQQVDEPWRIYREALRDVPEQPGFPREIEWPAMPA